MYKYKHNNNLIIFCLSIISLLVINIPKFSFATDIQINNLKDVKPIESYIQEFNVQLITDPKDIIITTKSTATNSVSVSIATLSTISTTIETSEIFEHDGIKFKKSQLMGSFKLTGYCACKKCTLGTGITYSGKKVRENHTVAADLKILPIGTYIILEGIEDGAKKYNGVYQVEDKGGGVKNKHIDIYQPTHELASLVTYHGYTHANVYIATAIE